MFALFCFVFCFIFVCLFVCLFLFLEENKVYLIEGFNVTSYQANFASHIILATAMLVSFSHSLVSLLENTTKCATNFSFS